MTTVPKAIADRLAAALRDTPCLCWTKMIRGESCERCAALRAYESQQAVEAVTGEDYRQALVEFRHKCDECIDLRGQFKVATNIARQIAITLDDVSKRAAELAAARAGKEKGNG